MMTAISQLSRGKLGFIALALAGSLSTLVLILGQKHDTSPDLVSASQLQNSNGPTLGDSSVDGSHLTRANAPTASLPGAPNLDLPSSVHLIPGKMILEKSEPVSQATAQSDGILLIESQKRLRVVIDQKEIAWRESGYRLSAGLHKILINDIDDSQRSARFSIEIRPDQTRKIAF